MSQILQRANILLLLILLFSLPFSGYCLDIKFPGNGFVENWTLKGPIRQFNRNDLYGHINGGSELFLEFGFNVLRLQEYTNTVNNSEIALETYEMECPEAALGIYLAKCGTDNAVQGIEPQARCSGDHYQLLLLKGNYFITVNNFSGESSFMPVMVKLANAILEQIPPAPPTDLFEILPKENRVAGSEMLFRGQYGLTSVYTLGNDDILLQQNQIFGVTAQYEYQGSGKTETTGQVVIYNRLFVRYPDENSAKKAFTHLKANLDSYIKLLENQETLLTFSDYRGKFGRVTLNKNILSIEVNLPEIK